MFTGHRKVFYGSKADKFDIAGIGCIHAGHSGFDRDYFEKVMAWIPEQDNWFVMGMGDYFDEITTQRHHYDVNQLDKEFAGYENSKGPLKRVIEYVTDQFRPLAEAGQLLGFIEGNHDYIITKNTGYSYVMIMAEELGVPYLGHSTLFRLSFQRAKSEQRTKFDIYAVHGAYGGAKAGGKINKLEQMAKDFDANLYMMGHVHDIISYTRPRLYLDNNINIKDKRLAFMITGSFLKTYDEGGMGYGEKKMYSPVKIGFPKAQFWPAKGDLHVSE